MPQIVAESRCVNRSGRLKNRSATLSAISLYSNRDIRVIVDLMTEEVEVSFGHAENGDQQTDADRIGLNMNRGDLTMLLNCRFAAAHPRTITRASTTEKYAAKCNVKVQSSKFTVHSLKRRTQPTRRSHSTPQLCTMHFELCIPHPEPRTLLLQRPHRNRPAIRPAGN